MYLSGTKDITLESTSLQALGEHVQYSAASPAKLGAQLSLDVCRLLDVIIALSVLIFIGPLMLAISLMIRAQDGGPALFSQSRIGEGGKSFKCLKFRTMVIDAEARLGALLARDPEARREWEADHKLRKDPRITALGAFLRKSSLDELPQLFNVLKGEMSLVGPRPIVASEAARYGRWFAYYCAVKPGVTGLWQVNGRNDVSYRRRVALDVLYAKTIGVRRYLQVIAATVPAVLMRSGSY
ncbi:sugar transferase [Phenylobacterium sp.]|uniref:sugar transferase n=1 Tax=Phenylobacterium sp. TaxID=1871053 RepID=UPI002730C7FD|nr:sugar transferase [Phenylobacterium sp.]MDP1875916.1 sugar transferase [Phenylobacterium sp.]